jgi:RNA polymerase sigma-70 factor, ECF subfamily
MVKEHTAMAAALSERTLRHWMARFGPALINLSAGICRDRHQAEEIVQEAFVKLWKSPPDVGEIAYAAWLRKVVTNLSINALKRTRRAGPLPEAGADERLRPGARPSRDPEAMAETADDLAHVTAALDRLDESKRAILLLRAQEDLSYDAIAEHLGVPIGTVMSRLNRARTALLDELDRTAASQPDQPEAFDIRRYKQA